MSDINTKLGELLRLEREQKGVTLEDLSVRLKISESNLRSIETGDTKAVPSELYFNLFTKSYCEAMGVDYTRTKEAIKMELEEKPPEEGLSKSKGSAGAVNRSEAESETTLLKKLGWLFGAIVVAFVLFLTASKLFFSDKSSAKSTEGDETTEQATSSDQTELVAFDWNVPGYKPDEPLKLKLTPRGESWTTVIADGDTVLFQNLMPGRSYEAEAEYRLLVSVGVPRSVDVELNGVEVNLADPETRRISRVYIDQMNIDNILNPQLADNPSDTGSGAGE
ncbi:MAG: DUF4115 domain-containing protein [bacterium]|nr:DUF4115 domain-containing protein [bacterium]